MWYLSTFSRFPNEARLDWRRPHSAISFHPAAFHFKSLKTSKATASPQQEGHPSEKDLLALRRRGEPDRLGLLAMATVSEDGWVDLTEPLP